MSVTLKIAPSFGEVENFDMQVPESIKAEELKTLLMQKLQQDGEQPPKTPSTAAAFLAAQRACVPPPYDCP